MFQRSLRFNITAMFTFLVLCNIVGLYAVQIRARDYAAARATAQTRKDREQDRYNISVQRYNSNKAACGIRKLVDLDGQRKLLATYQDAAKDPSVTPSARKRNAARIIAQKKSIKNAKNVIELFATIPPDFNCKNLPKHPPRPPNVS